MKENLYIMKKIDSTEQDYFEVVSNYINYYSRRAQRCKNQYYGANIVKFIALASIPVIQMTNIAISRPWIAGSASAVCLFVESIMALWRTREKWIMYRDSYNMLTNEQRQYAIGYGKYYGERKQFQEFVVNVEKIISDEARKWSETVREKKDEQDNNKENYESNNKEE